MSPPDRRCALPRPDLRCCVGVSGATVVARGRHHMEPDSRRRVSRPARRLHGRDLVSRHAGGRRTGHASASAPRVVETITGLRFAPGVGPDVLGIPAHELRDTRVSLDALGRRRRSGASPTRRRDRSDRARPRVRLCSPTTRYGRSLSPLPAIRAGCAPAPMRPSPTRSA